MHTSSVKRIIILSILQCYMCSSSCKFSCMVTGSQDQHRAIRLKVEHMRDIGPLMMKLVIENCSSYSNCGSIDEYIDRSKMDQDVLGAVILNCCVFLSWVKLACSRIPKSWAIGISMGLTMWTGP